MRSHLQILVITAICLFYSCVTCLQAEPTLARMLGGSRHNTAGSAFAYVSNSISSCSGTLVASNLVLTAAHCTDDLAKNFAVSINSEIFAVKEVWHHERFNHDQAYTLSKAAFDLGMLVLTKDVTSVSPLPIVYNSPITKNSKASFIGYGLNENSAFESVSARLGQISAAAVFDAFITFDSQKSAATSCAGDSGAAITQSSKDSSTSWMIGVDIAGTNNIDEMGNCVIANNGQSYAINLQSQQASEFLSRFSAIRYINGSDIKAKFLATSIRGEIKKATQSKLSTSKKRIQYLRKKIKQLSNLVSADRTFKLKKISTFLRYSLKSNSLDQFILALQKSVRTSKRLALL